jgi:hypothetical protein
MSSALGRNRGCCLAKGGSTGARSGSVLSTSRMDVVERELRLFRRLLRLLGVLFRASLLDATGGFLSDPSATAVPNFNLAGFRRPNGHTGIGGS